MTRGLLVAAVAALLGAGTEPAPNAGSVVCYTSEVAYNLAISRPAADRRWLGIGGAYDWQQQQIRLTPNECSALEHVRAGPTDARALAIFTFAHETAHALGVMDENEADCQAARSFRWFAFAFGARGSGIVDLERRAKVVSGYDASAIAECWPAS